MRTYCSFVLIICLLIASIGSKTACTFSLTCGAPTATALVAVVGRGRSTVLIDVAPLLRFTSRIRVLIPIFHVLVLKRTAPDALQYTVL